MSLTELEDASGVQDNYIWRLEQGRFKQPGEALSRLAKALGTTYEDIVSCGAGSIATLYDAEVVRIAIEGEDGAVYVPRHDLDCATTSPLQALRVTDDALPSDRIAIGDVIVIDPEFIFEDGRLFYIRYRGQWAKRRLARENDCYLMRGDGLDVRVPQEDVVIVGRIIYVDKGYPL